MKPEDAAREYEENQSSPSGMIGQDAKAFLAGHAHAVKEIIKLIDARIEEEKERHPGPSGGHLLTAHLEAMDTLEAVKEEITSFATEEK